MTTFRIAKLAGLVGGWSRTTQVRSLIEQLTEKVAHSKEPHLGAPLPDDVVAHRLPPGIGSAWIFVIKPKATTPAHKHPNSIQHSAFLSGQGVAIIGRQKGIIQPFDPAYPERSLYVIPENVPHSFEAYNEPLVILSFHTVAPEDLIETEVGTGKRRRYVDQDGASLGRNGGGAPKPGKPPGRTGPSRPSKPTRR